MSGAPSAVSGFMRQEVSFGGSRNLSMVATCILAEIGQNTSDTGALVSPSYYNQAMMLSPQGQGSVVGGGTLVAGAQWISPVTELISAAFTRYRCKRLRFHYRPQSPTTTTARLIFAFASDPAHPLILTTSPSVPQLEAVADSLPFAPWTEWTMDVSKSLDADNWKYVQGNGSTPTTDVDLINRFSDFGVIGCLADTVGSANVVFGALYVEFELEFKEFCPITITAPTLSAEKHPKLKRSGNPLARAARYNPTVESSSASSLDVASSSPTSLEEVSLVLPSSRATNKVVELEEFVEKFRACRRNGDCPEEACKKASTGGHLAPAAMALVFKSGLEKHLGDPKGGVHVDDRKEVVSRVPSWEDRDAYLDLKGLRITSCTSASPSPPDLLTKGSSE